MTTVTATDPDAGQTLTYSIVGGADSALFSLDPTTHALAFITGRDFEAPADAGGDNIYDVTVQVSDGQGGSDTQAIAVMVQNVNGADTIGNSQAQTLTGTRASKIRFPGWAVMTLSSGCLEMIPSMAAPAPIAWSAASETTSTGLNVPGMR